MKTETTRLNSPVVQALVSLACIGLLTVLLVTLLLGGQAKSPGESETADEALADRFNMYITNRVSDALAGVLDVEKVYWLKDEDTIAPEPDPNKFGTTSDPSTLQWFLEDAQGLLRGEKTVFSLDTPLQDGSEVIYYLDETIMCITWKRPIGTAMYTFSEVKIAHPSQFRRFLADGQYGSERQYYATEMAAAVNAVTASNADFYKYRPLGIVVYNGQVYRADNRVDTCFIDDQGELLFARAGQINTWDEAQRFVDDNNIRFSLAFGPVLIENGENVVPERYLLGEITGAYSRAAIAQLGPLHYLMVVTGYEDTYRYMPGSRQFADVLIGMGVEKAYSLDGGQTGVIVTNDKLINRPNYGFQRTVSDIIYFATAVPDGG